MEAPANVEVIEIRTSLVWKEESGVIVSVAKPEVRSVADSKEQVDLLMKLSGGKKVALVADLTKAKPLSKEVRDYGEEVLPDTLSCFAIVTNSAVGRMLANLFFGLKKPPYPTKIFKDPNEARDWAKDYVIS